MKYIYCYLTKLGEMGIIEENHFITEIKFDTDQVLGEIIISETPLIHKTYEEIMEYFQGTRKEFSIPIKPNGTPYQEKVWEAIKHIPYGTTKTPEELAYDLGNEKSYRSVGTATSKNPIPIIIPSHRLIAKDQIIKGPSNIRKRKKQLLKIEKARLK